MGIQNDDLLMPVRRISGTYAIAAPMNATAEELLGSLQTKEVEEMYSIRIYCGMGVFMGMFVMIGNFIPFRVDSSFCYTIVCSTFDSLYHYCNPLNQYCLLDYLDCNVWIWEYICD